MLVPRILASAGECNNVSGEDRPCPFSNGDTPATIASTPKTAFFQPAYFPKPCEYNSLVMFSPNVFLNVELPPPRPMIFQRSANSIGAIQIDEITDNIPAISIRRLHVELGFELFSANNSPRFIELKPQSL